jgi:simple sugar transport system permease protein
MTARDEADRVGGSAAAVPRLVTIKRRSRLRGIGDVVLRWREGSILFAGILLAIYFQSSNSAFLSSSNIDNLIDYTATTAIIAAGEVMVLVCGELDLSAGMVYALSPFLMHFAMAAGIPGWLAIVLALTAAGGVGLINGVVTTLLDVPAFVTTLGTMFLINGFTLTISGGFPVEPSASPGFAALFGASVWARLGWAVAIALILQLVLSRTRFGLHTIATGGNPTAAAEVGIRVRDVKVRNFVLCSVLAGFAGIIDAFRIGSIDPLAGGSEITFAAIAAAVIGGTLLTGGVGTLVGALIGALVLGILKDGFTLLGVSAYTFDMILGAAILVTMVVNVRLTQWRERGGA